MLYAILLVIAAVGIVYVGHLQRKTLEVQSALIAHLTDIVKADGKVSVPQSGDDLDEIISKAQVLPS